MTKVCAIGVALIALLCWGQDVNPSQLWRRPSPSALTAPKPNHLAYHPVGPPQPESDSDDADYDPWNPIVNAAAPARGRARRGVVQLATPANERRARPEHRRPPGRHHFSPQRRLHRPGLHAAHAPVRSGAAGRSVIEVPGQAGAGRGAGVPGAAWRRGPGRSRASGCSWRPGRTELPRCPAGPPPLTKPFDRHVLGRIDGTRQ